MENKSLKLEELAVKITDGAHHSPKDFKNGFPMLSVKDMRENGFDFKNCKRISEEDFDKLISSGCKPEIDDILIAKDGSVLKHIFRVKEEPNYVLLSSIAIVRPNKDIVEPEFLAYSIKNPVTKELILNNYLGGTGVPRIVLKDFKKIDFDLPPLPKQKAIASVLSSLDDKIDLLHQQNQTLEALAETLFRQWFIVNAKEDWEERPLSSIANFLNGLACQKFPPKDSINRLPVLKIKDLTSGISENSDWASTDVKPEYIIKNGDVIFAWSASLMVKIWNGEDCIINQHLFKVTSEEFPKWFYYFWCKQHLREFISIAQSHATTMGHIKRSDLDEAMVLIPDNDEIEKMTFQMNPILDKIQLNNNQINSFTKLRDTLLPKLMSGEVRVKN